MIKNEQFDVGVMKNFTRREMPISFEIEHALSADLVATQTAINHEKLKTFKVVSYLYGRLQVENNSYFAEIFGYIDKENPSHLTYHIAHIDKSFHQNYYINYSDSDFCEEDYFALS